MWKIVLPGSRQKQKQINFSFGQRTSTRQLVHCPYHLNRNSCLVPKVTNSASCLTVSSSVHLINFQNNPKRIFNLKCNTFKIFELKRKVVSTLHILWKAKKSREGVKPRSKNSTPISLLSPFLPVQRSLQFPVQFRANTIIFRWEIWELAFVLFNYIRFSLGRLPKH